MMGTKERPLRSLCSLAETVVVSFAGLVVVSRSGIGHFDQSTLSDLRHGRQAQCPVVVVVNMIKLGCASRFDVLGYIFGLNTGGLSIDSTH